MAMAMAMALRMCPAALLLCGWVGVSAAAVGRMRWVVDWVAG